MTLITSHAQLGERLCNSLNNADDFAVLNSNENLPAILKFLFGFDYAVIPNSRAGTFGPYRGEAVKWGLRLCCVAQDNKVVVGVLKSYLQHYRTVCDANSNELPYSLDLKGQTLYGWQTSRRPLGPALVNVRLALRLAAETLYTADRFAAAGGQVWHPKTEFLRCVPTLADPEMVFCQWFVALYRGETLSESEVTKLGRVPAERFKLAKDYLVRLLAAVRTKFC